MKLYVHKYEFYKESRFWSLHYMDLYGCNYSIGANMI